MCTARVRRAVDAVRSSSEDEEESSGMRGSMSRTFVSDGGEGKEKGRWKRRGMAKESCGVWRARERHGNRQVGGFQVEEKAREREGAYK